jgi:hypothetical protein
MREFAFKSATEEPIAGLLRIMHDIANVRAATAPIATAGYRALSVRPVPSADKPSGFFTALFAGGFGLAVLAGPATCPTCDAVHTVDQLNVGRMAAPTPTAAIGAATNRVPDSAPALSAVKTTLRAGKLPDTIEELTDQGPPGGEIAAATVGSELETPPGTTMLPSQDITAVESGGPALRQNPTQNQVSIKQRRARVASSPPKLYSPSRSSHVPGWAAKMFETPWQNKAFAFQ